MLLLEVVHLLFNVEDLGVECGEEFLVKVGWQWGVHISIGLKCWGRVIISGISSGGDCGEVVAGVVWFDDGCRIVNGANEL